MSREPLDVLLDELRDPDEQDAAQYVIERDYGRAAVPKLIERLAGCDEDCLCVIEALQHVGDATALELGRA